MDNEQLNSLAIKAKNGDWLSMWQLKGYFHSYIAQLSDTSRNHISSQEKFEDECFKLIEETVSRFDSSRGNFRQLVVNSFKRRLGRMRSRYREKLERYDVEFVPLRCRTSTDEDGFQEYDVEDRLAAVEAKILLNEKIASLAGSDPRKMAILNTWATSTITDTLTADLLAQAYGGKAESHRKFVTRFKSQCQTALADAV